VPQITWVQPTLEYPAPINSDKTCTQCGGVKPRTDFHKRAKSPDGLQPLCKACSKTKGAARYAANRETIRAKVREQYRADPEKFKSAARAAWDRSMERDPEGVREKGRIKAAKLRAAHPERYRESAKRYARNNPEKVAERSRKWNAATRPWEKPERKEYKRQWRQDNPDLMAAAQVRYRARKKAALIVRFTLEQLEDRLSMFSGCWMCGGLATEVEHVKPLEKGGAHCLSNLRPSCRSCNATKNAKWPYPTSTRFLAAA
jgi:5-methylcytosine-specific restriction endonuclease McrA